MEQAPVRLLVLVIATRDEPYGLMKDVWLCNWALHAPPGARLWFLYDTPGRSGFDQTAVRGCLDYHVDQPPSLIPGVLDKTLAAFRTAADFDYVFRTNLSSFVDLTALHSFLQGRPRRRFMSGCSPDRSHLSGCGYALSADLVRELAERPLDRGLIDDVATSRVLLALPGCTVHWAARSDHVDADPCVVHNPDQPLYHHRCKHANRVFDVAHLRLLFLNCWDLPRLPRA